MTPTTGAIQNFFDHFFTVLVESGDKKHKEGNDQLQGG